MNEEKQEYKTTRLIYTVGFITLIVLLFLRIGLIAFCKLGIPEAIAAVLDELISTLIAALVIYGFYYYYAKRNAYYEISVLRRGLLEGLLTKERAKTDFWFFDGGAGSYTRKTHLPSLMNAARRKKASIEIKMIMIDPSSESACYSYSVYRNANQSDIKWNPHKARIGILSTIASACYLKNLEPLLDIQIGFKEHYSILRHELSSDVLVISNDDHREPFILAEKDSFVYKSYKENYRQQFSSISNIIIINKDKVLKDVSVEEIKSLLTILNLDQTGLTEGDFETIISEISKINLKADA